MAIGDRQDDVTPGGNQNYRARCAVGRRDDNTVAEHSMTDDNHLRVEARTGASVIPTPVDLANAQSEVIGSVDDEWKNTGDVIDMDECNALMVMCDLTINNSTGAQIRFLGKHTAGGSQLYVFPAGVGFEYTLGSSDIEMMIPFFTQGLYQYIQIQTKAAVVGTSIGEISIKIAKAWR